MPIVYEGLDFGAQMQELEWLCQAVGVPAATVTAVQGDYPWEIDEPLMERCAELRVDPHLPWSGRPDLNRRPRRPEPR